MRKVTLRARMVVGFGVIWLMILFIGYAGVSSLEKIKNGDITVTYINYAQLTIAAFTVLAVIIGLLLEIKTIRDVRRPVGMLKKAAELLAGGNANVELKKYSNDELGELTDAFEALVKNTRYQTSIAERLVKGQLDMAVKTKGEQDILGNAFARIVKENNLMLSNIREAAEQVTVGSEQVAGASQSLAQGSTEQASAIEEVTASIDEIADRTKRNAEQAKIANDLVHSVKNDAVTGNQQMKEMIAAMHQINDSSENISKIIKVIDDIAFQTNILALNAAVEAARAGVHGKGFAVVAEEVRNLAGKSSSAASETAEMIEDSIKKVELGSRLAQETAKALDEIMAAIDNSVELINNIAVTANDQATAVTQIDLALGQVSQVVQNNSATSQQCAAASSELSNQAAVLRELMSHYRLSGNKRQAIAQPTYDQYEEADNESYISLD